MSGPDSIRLGEQDLVILPLTLSKLRQLGPRLPRCIDWVNLRNSDSGFADFVAGSDLGLDDAMAIIAAATGMTEAKIGEIEATMGDAADAVLKIGILAHMVQVKEVGAGKAPTPGEA